jgi:hypothetical protein
MFNERYYTCSVTKTPIKPGDPVYERNTKYVATAKWIQFKRGRQ